MKTAALVAILLYAILISSSALAAVFINEVDLSPIEGYPQWVELYNSGNESVDITGWSIIALSDPSEEEIIDSEIISANDFYVVSLSEDWDNSHEETLILRNDQGIEVDRTPPLLDIYESNCAWSRYPDGSPYWSFLESTPYGPSTGVPCEIANSESLRVRFSMDGKVSGYGFIDTHNLMTTNDGEKFKSVEHGSGDYKSEEGAKYSQTKYYFDDFPFSTHVIGLSKTNLSASYSYTTLNISPLREIRLASKWTESSAAGSHENSPYISESYRDATSIDSDVQIRSNYTYDLTANIDSKFEGRGNVESSLTNFKSSEEYTGKFHVSDKFLKDYNIIESSATGVGLINVNRNVGDIVRTYEQGTGKYQADVLVDTYKESLAKNINLSHERMNYSYAPDYATSQSVMWREGTRSGESDKSFISTEFSNIKKLEDETVVVNPRNVETSANFSGKARMQAAFRNSSGSEHGLVSIDDEYEGNYSINRHVSIMPVYDVPHISIITQGHIEKPGCNVLKYTITLINDGNRALGPIYIIDTFPSGTNFRSTSIRPLELASTYANWSIPFLGSGDLITIDLDLQISKRKETYTNRVRAFTIYEVQIGKRIRDRTLRASNSSLLVADWSSCIPQNISATFAVTSDPKSPKILNYLLTVQNLAEENMSANITVSLPAYIRFINSTSKPLQASDYEITWTISKIAPQKRRTISFKCEAERDGLFVSRASIRGHSLDGREIAFFNVTAPIMLGEVVDVSTNYSLDWMPCDEEMLGPNSWDDFVSSEDGLGCMCTGDN
jgi:uncharacterized repeat protein (TIGR01451 family)